MFRLERRTVLIGAANEAEQQVGERMRIGRCQGDSLPAGGNRFRQTALQSPRPSQTGIGAGIVGRFIDDRLIALRGVFISSRFLQDEREIPGGLGQIGRLPHRAFQNVDGVVVPPTGDQDGSQRVQQIGALRA